MAIQEVLSHVGSAFADAQAEKFERNTFARWFRGEASDLIASVVERSDLDVQGSVGQGNWAEVAWFGIFNPESTTSATTGLYIVYLFSADLKSVFLCQGQGVTNIKKEFGRQHSAELLRRAALIRSRVPEHAKSFAPGPIQLGGSTSLAKSYDPAVAYFQKYDIASLPTEESLQRDLRQMVYLYDLLIARGGTDNVETAIAVSSAEDDLGEAQTIDEQRRYVRHLKIERRSTKKVKALLGYVCQACGFDFAEHYGELGKAFIEAHHLTPLHLLPEGEVVKMNAATDFAVLCANCHRMLHRNKVVLPLQELLRNEGVVRLRALFKSVIGTD